MKNKYLIFLLLLTIFAILIEGYRFGEENHTNYFSLAKAKIDSTLYTRDFYIHNTEYPGFFYDLLVRLSGDKLEWTSFFLYFFLLYFTFIMIFKLTKLLFNNDYVSYLSVLFSIIPKNTIGGAHTRDYALQHSTFVFPFLLLAIYLFLKRRYIWSFIFLGLSFNFHGMTSIFVLSMFLLYFLFKFNKIGKFKIFLSFGSLIIASLPFLITVLGRKKESLIPSPLWIDVARTRAGLHLFPSTWAISVWLNFIPIMILFFLAYKFRNKKREIYNRTIAIFSLAVFIMLILGFVFSEILPIRSIIQLHLLRSAPFLVIFALLYSSNYIYGLIMKPKFSHNLLGIFLGVALFYNGNMKVYLAILLYVIVAFIILRYFKKTKWFKAALISSVLVFLIIGSIGANIWKGENHVNLPWTDYYDEWIDIQLWSKNNTKKDALFVTRYDKPFRFYSERSIFVSGKDLGLGIILNPNGEEIIPEYLKRLNFINCNFLEESKKCIENYNELSEEDILKIKEEYDIDYIIFDKPKKLNFQVAYENNKFIIFSV